nr:MAG TPA: hypothetical protein [Caudoviricetes sp.]
MKSLESLMGLTQQGIPNEMAYPNDPMLQSAMMGDNNALMEQLGVTVEDPYELLNMPQPQGANIGNELTTQMLGQSAPRLSQPELNALAQAIGIGTPSYDPMVDPMYAQQFNIMSILGGK